MNRWHSKHPIPWDFFYSMNDAAGKNMNWFWQNWFFTNGYIDLAIDKVEKKRKDYNIIIKNIGGFFVPVDLIVTYNDGTKETLHQTPELWHNNAQSAVVTIKTSKEITGLTLEGGIFMDAHKGDNVWKK